MGLLAWGTVRPGGRTGTPQRSVPPLVACGLTLWACGLAFGCIPVWWALALNQQTQGSVHQAYWGAGF